MSVKPFTSAVFFSTDNGATVQRRSSGMEEEQAPLPGNVTNIFRFDETQPNNAATSALWASDATRFTMNGNTVLLDDDPIGFDPPGLLFEALENAADLWTKLSETPDALSRQEQAQLGALSFLGADLFE